MAISSRGELQLQGDQKGPLTIVNANYARLIASLMFAVPFLTNTVPVFAGQPIKWSQTLNIPKGQGLPPGVRADILGIEIGDSYVEAKRKLQAIKKQLPQGDDGRISETQSFFKLPVGSGNFIESKFPSLVKLSISRRAPRTTEEITLHITAPSSGAQVIGIERLIKRWEHKDQVRISDFAAAVSRKFGSTPTVDAVGDAAFYRYHYDDGRAVTAPRDVSATCPVSYWLSLGKNERQLPKINKGGMCDIVLEVQFNYGISKDHAQAVWFRLIDAERAKANHMADYQYMRDYLARLQQGTSGKAPKL